MEIERLVFVCPDITTACLNPLWKKFCVGPIRQTRPFIKSRFILFKNIMLELLQVIDHKDAKNFVFFEEWKQARKPTWVGTGCKVDSLDNSLNECEKYDIYPIETIVQKDTSYKKEFRHQSCLLSKKWSGKQLYLTEYDSRFLDQRMKALCKDPQKKNAFYVTIPPFSLEDVVKEKDFGFEEKGNVKLNIHTNAKKEKYFFYDFDWIFFHQNSNSAVTVVENL